MHVDLLFCGGAAAVLVDARIGRCSVQGRKHHVGAGWVRGGCGVGCLTTQL